MELEKNLAPETKEKLKTDPRYDYLSFKTELWVDRLQNRFRTVQDFRNGFTNSKHQKMAETAYKEIVEGAARPGSPHLDRHVQDFYMHLTHEKSVDLEVEGRRRMPGYSEADNDRDAKLLKEAAKIIAEADAEDGAYREKKGFAITEELE